MYTKYYKTVKMFHIFFLERARELHIFYIKRGKEYTSPYMGGGGGGGNTTLAD
jgi:hypothetical protein